MIKSQESTRKLFEFQRKCKFEEESTLTYFPQIYTQDLCRLDCRMRKFLEICNCLPFFYKRKGTKYHSVSQTSTTRVFYLKVDSDKKCDIKGLKCIAKNKGKKSYLDFITISPLNRIYSFGRCNRNKRLLLSERLQRHQVLGSGVKYNVLVPQFSCIVDDDADEGDLQARTHSRIHRSFGLDRRKLFSLRRHELPHMR